MGKASQRRAERKQEHAAEPPELKRLHTLCQMQERQLKDLASVKQESLRLAQRFDTVVEENRLLRQQVDEAKGAYAQGFHAGFVKGTNHVRLLHYVPRQAEQRILVR